MVRNIYTGKVVTNVHTVKFKCVTIDPRPSATRAAAVVPMKDDGTVVRFGVRHAAGDSFMKSAGKLSGEDPLHCAARVEEEVGYRAASFEPFPASTAPI